MYRLRFRRNNLSLPMVAWLAAVPLSYEPADVAINQTPGATTVRVSGGTGSIALVTRDCEGGTNASQIGYQDAGIDVEHRMSRMTTLGARAGHVSYDRGGSVTFIQPYMTVGSSPVRVGLGPIVGGDGFLIGRGFFPREGDVIAGGFLRAGGARTYVEIDIASRQPLYSSGGLVRLGGNLQLSDRMDLYGGLGAGFFDAGGAVVRARFYARPTVTTDVGVRLGASAGVSESAIFAGVGLTLR